mgnify:CR=1 FL=1
MRLIDADHLIQIVCGATILPDGFKNVFRKLVAGEPTVDRPTRSQFKRMAVQLGYEKVVHCKDCKHKDTWTESKIRDWFWCGVSGLQVVEDMDFCSYGERRTDEQ